MMTSQILQLRISQNTKIKIIRERNIREQPPRGVPRKRCSENMQQIYRRTPMLKCDFNKAAATLLKSHFGMGVLL